MYIIATSSYVKFKLKPSTINHNYATRQKSNKNLILPSNKNDTNAKFIDFLGLKIYNRLPKEIRTIPQLKHFNKESKLFILINRNKFSDIFKEM